MYGKLVKTTNGMNRYPLNSYERINFNMIPIFYGNTTQLYIMEKIYLYKYYLTHGRLPYGNRIFR